MANDKEKVTATVRLAAEAATTFAPTGEIETARTEVLALVTSQDAAMARLWEIMGQ